MPAPPVKPRTGKRQACWSSQTRWKYARMMDFERNQSTSILSLPGEMLELVFSKLTTEERKPLGMVCKRFRNADFELGNKTFDSIYAHWNLPFQSISGFIGKSKHFIMGEAKEPIQATPQNLRLFRKAHTEELNIVFRKAAENERSQFDYISNIFKAVTYKKLNVTLDVDADYSERFMPTLVADRDLKNSEVTFNIDGRKSTINLRNTRQMLMELPMLRKFILHRHENWSVSSTDPDDVQIIDDAALLHITANANYTYLRCNGDITAQGILNAFELVRKSTNDTKYAKFMVMLTSNAIDDLFSTPNLKFARKEDRAQRTLRDRKNSAILIATSMENYFHVEMGKTDAGGNLKRDMR